MPDWNTISDHLEETCGELLDVHSAQPVGGGCISTAYSVKTDSRRVFVKINSAPKLAMFEAESEGLMELAKSRSIRVPEPLCYGIAGSESYLVMEHLKLGSPTNSRSSSAKQLGQNLAALHQVTQTKNGEAHYGWFRSNTIGSTPQINDGEDDWATFWAKQRLGYQLALARHKGANKPVLAQGEKLCENLNEFFVSYTPEASLLHGDLWSGNFAYDQAGQPVIFDPAVYYGDRETDLAMTELFGGFPADFYAAYNESYPLDEGYPTRKTLYNLYHILNHYNLFGGGYLSQASSMIDQLLSELN
ncbi:MAG: fructosamine kinase family protein [Gammaproteobacteria bacterium]